MQETAGVKPGGLSRSITGGKAAGRRAEHPGGAEGRRAAATKNPPPERGIERRASLGKTASFTAPQKAPPSGELSSGSETERVHSRKQHLPGDGPSPSRLAPCQLPLSERAKAPLKGELAHGVRLRGITPEWEPLR